MAASPEPHESHELHVVNGVVRKVRNITEQVAAQLSDARVTTEALATYIPPRRVLLWTRPARMQTSDKIWRLGALLLSPSGSLYAAGKHTRAAERGRPGYQSVSREERREIAAAALRSGFAAGEPVNFDATLLLQAGSVVSNDETAPTGMMFGENSPLGLVDGEVRVRWNPTAPLATGPTLEAYLTERATLLISPPQTAN